MYASNSVPNDASHFWNGPEEFSTTHSTSTATMFDLLGKTKILCLVILPKKDGTELYRGDKILKEGWEQVVSKSQPPRVLGYKNMKARAQTDENLNDIKFPFSNEYPFMYKNPVVKYAFYAHTLDKKSTPNENMYALIGSNGISTYYLTHVEDTCLPFPKKMSDRGKDLPYNPEQFPNRNGYLENRNPTLVEFSKFLKENPNVGCFYVTYDDGEVMRKRRSEEKERDRAAALARQEEFERNGPYYDQHDSFSQGEWEKWMRRRWGPQPQGHQHRGQPQKDGGVPKYVVPTITPNLFEFSHSTEYTPPTSGHVSDRYILDKDGVADFTGRIKKFGDEFFGTEYKKKVNDSIDAMVKKRLQKYIDAIPTAIELEIPGLIPEWLLDKAKSVLVEQNMNYRQYYINYINDYLNKPFDKEESSGFLSKIKGKLTELKGKVTGKTGELKSLKERIDEKRAKLRSTANLKRIEEEFVRDAILQFPTRLSERNTGLAGLMRNKEVIERNYTKLLTSFCCLFFVDSFKDILRRTIDVDTFEIFRESNNPNSNLLKALYLVIDNIEANQANPAAPVAVVLDDFSKQPVVLGNSMDVAQTTQPVDLGTGWADFSKHPGNQVLPDTQPVDLGTEWADFSKHPDNQVLPDTQPADLGTEWADFSKHPGNQPVPQGTPSGTFWKDYAHNLPDVAGGGIGKPYGKKNRKRYSRKRYSRKRYSRKRYSGKNRKRYSGKNRKRYSGKNKKRYSKKNRK